MEKKRQKGTVRARGQGMPKEEDRRAGSREKQVTHVPTSKKKKKRKKN